MLSIIFLYRNVIIDKIVPQKIIYRQHFSIENFFPITFCHRYLAYRLLFFTEDLLSRIFLHKILLSRSFLHKDLLSTLFSIKKPVIDIISFFRTHVIDQYFFTWTCYRSLCCRNGLLSVMFPQLSKILSITFLYAELVINIGNFYSVIGNFHI